MTSLPGGASDKAGNAYAALWTTLRVTDLLRGEASRIRLEPPGDDGVGVEFEVDISGETWGEQTKSSDANWTIKRLRTDGVLAAAKQQIERGRVFALVTSSAATDMDALSHRARSTQTIDEFRGLLTTKLLPAFEDVRSSWGAEEDDAWKLLKSIHVEHHPTASLRKSVRLALQTLYADDADLVAAAVQEFCSSHVHQDIHAPQVAAYLREKGLRERLLGGDEDARRRLYRTLERQQRRVLNTAPEHGFVSRPETAGIVDDLQDMGRQQIVVLDAPAGYGKSAVVAEVASTLNALGWFVAVARMDGSAGIPTSDHLGQEMGLSDSPAVLLAGVAQGAPGLLVVDQLDAVSLFSGRMPDAFDAVDEVLAEVARTLNLKVLLVVRTVDLESDQRLRSLLRDEQLVGRRTLGRLDAAAVRQYLQDHGLSIPSDETLKLLCTPLHLSVYGRLSSDAQSLPYRTLKDLYDQLTADVRRRAAARAGGLDWPGITSLLVATMSQDETLTVARGALVPFRPEELAALESEGVLAGDESRVGFFHESYFDYLFAQGFVASGQDIHAFISASGQFLFRRAQTRQILEYLAASEDRRAFRDAVALLLVSPDIRTHLKHVAVTVLRQIEPQREDWAAVEELAWSDDPIGPHIISLLGDYRWFDAADDLGRWEAWLADPERVDRAINQLISASRQRGSRVTELVTPYIGTSEDWRLRLRALVSWSLVPELVPLAVRLVSEGYIDDARGPIAVNSDFWSLLHGLADDDAAGASRVAGAFLQRGLRRALDDGSDDPFESRHIDGRSPSGSVIRDIADGAPVPFLREVLPFVIAVAQANLRTRDGFLPTGSRWMHRWQGAGHSIDDILFFATEAALIKAAQVDSEFVKQVVSDIGSMENEALRFLACRALVALDDHDEAVGWLLADSRNLDLGWADSPNWASRQLVAEHSPGCSDEMFGRLETAILAHRPGSERRGRGHAQYALLDGLERSRLSELGRRRLAELGRLFESAPPAPRGAVASFVGSPIADEPSKMMSDDNWMAALQKHSSEAINWSVDRPVGGASQLAQVLERRSREDPLRFALLALRFDESIPATAGAHVLQGVREAIDLELLSNLCEHLEDLYGEDVGREVCRAVEGAPAVDHRLVALVARYSMASDPEQELARTKAGGGDQYFFGGDLFSAGINSTRGCAALAAAAVLYKGDEHIAALLPVVQRLATDETLAVRTCAAEALLPLLNHAKKQALDSAAALMDAPVEVLDARTTEVLLAHCVLRRPQQFATILHVALQATGSVAERGGRVWAVADYRGSIVAPLPGAVSGLPVSARKGAAGALADNVVDSADALALLFDDPDEEIRATASMSLRHISEVAPGAVDALIRAFVQSGAFDANLEALVDGLESFGSRLPAAALEACEQVVARSGREIGDIRTARSLIGRDLIVVVIRLYRQGDSEVRRRCLDIVDRLIEIDAYGLHDALAEER